MKAKYKYIKTITIKNGKSEYNSHKINYKIEKLWKVKM